MLRTVLAALIAANLLFFGFTQGWLDGWFGLRADGDREPQRIVNQVRPETVVILAAGPPASAAVARCLEAGPFGNLEAPAVEAALRAALPAGSWSEVTVAGTAPGTATHTFRIETGDETVAGRAADLRLDPSGRTFSPCRRP